MPIALAYVLFVAWYTDFGGPLTDEEIDGYLEAISVFEESQPEMRARLEKF